MRLIKDGARWQLAPEFEPFLDKLLRDPGELVKETPDTRITRHRIDTRQFYVKRYRHRRFWFGRSPARAEWDMAGQFVARGIPVVRHLALGERRTWSGVTESIVITEGFDGVRLDQFPVLATDELQAALGRFVKRLHDQGVLQDDLHHNLLARAAPLQLCRIDVDRGQIKPRLTRQEMLDNLARILLTVPLTDAFFRAYGLDDGAAQEVRQRHLAVQREWCAHRARRCRQRNARFQPVRAGGRRWWVRREFLDDSLRRLLEQPAAGGHARFRVQESADALASYQTAFHLELLGLAVARPVAATAGYVITETIPAASASGGPPAEWLARLRAAEFAGRELTDADFQRGADGRVYLVNCDGLRYRPQ